MVIFENIDIDKANLKNIDIDIDKEVLENIDIDIDKEILENIDFDKITNQLEFGISNWATGHGKMASFRNAQNSIAVSNNFLREWVGPVTFFFVTAEVKIGRRYKDSIAHLT